jgi:energy-coupling factor transporter ATP-binding protein EcfA2
VGCPEKGGRRRRSGGEGGTQVGEDVCAADNGSGPVLDRLTRPLTVLVGHAGSGKSEIAVNLAFALRARGAEVTLVDLDLVKPYFRCRLVREELEARGIRLVAPGGDHFYADLPMLVPGVRVAAGDGIAGERRVLFDVGGSDLGARVLGSLADVLDRSATELLFVVNAHRPFAGDAASLGRMLRAVQGAARLEMTGLVANTHLMEETTAEDVRAGIRAARELEAATGIPLRFCAALAGLARTLDGPDGGMQNLPILAMERHIVAPFVPRPRGARRPLTVV